MRYIFVFILFYFQNHAQLKNENYYQIGGESDANILIFENDSVAKLVPRSSHILHLQTTTLWYSKSNNTLCMHSKDYTECLKIVGNALVNYKRRIVYVLAKDFGKNPPAYFYYKNRFYQVGKVRGKLKRKLQNQNRDLEVKLIKGFDAYEKYGYEYSFGVIEVN